MLGIIQQSRVPMLGAPRPIVVGVAVVAAVVAVAVAAIKSILYVMNLVREKLRLEVRVHVLEQRQPNQVAELERVKQELQRARAALEVERAAHAAPAVLAAEIPRPAEREAAVAEEILRARVAELEAELAEMRADPETNNGFVPLEDARAVALQTRVDELEAALQQARVQPPPDRAQLVELPAPPSAEIDEDGVVVLDTPRVEPALRAEGIVRLETKVRDYEGKLTAAQQQIEVQQAHHAAQTVKISTLEEQLAQAEAARADLQGRLSQSTGDLAQAVSVRDSHSGKISALEERLARAGAARVDLQSRLDRLTAHVAEVKRVSDLQKDVKIRELEAQLTELNRARAAAEAEILGLKARLEAAELRTGDMEAS